MFDTRILERPTANPPAHAARAAIPEPQSERPNTPPPVERSWPMHPLVIGGAIAGWALILLAFWVLFFGDPGMEMNLFIVTGISVVMLGLLAGIGFRASGAGLQTRTLTHFRDFLRGQVETQTGAIPGRDAFKLVAGMAAGLALAGVGFAIIISAVR
ncbi:MAG: hypothetical protein M0002_20620 [Rhodospirillales bacterium]|nr:hypothetical protein [Rhodospirillales bacterium]